MALVLVRKVIVSFVLCNAFCTNDMASLDRQSNKRSKKFNTLNESSTKGQVAP